MIRTLNTARPPSGATIDYYGLAIQVADLSSTTEPDIARLIHQHVRPGDRVLCGGLGTGSTSVLAASLAGNENVWTVEPDADLIELAAGNIALAGRPLQIEEGALDTDDGRIELHVADWYGRTSVYAAIASTDAETRVVPSLSCRRLIEVHRSDILILDVEGAEHEIIPSLDLGRLQVVIAELHQVPGRDIARCLHDLVHAFPIVTLHICHGSPGLAVAATRVRHC